jgi:hypothetical protein
VIVSGHAIPRILFLPGTKTLVYVRDMARSRPVVSVEVTAADVRVLVPRQREPEPAGLPMDVLVAIEAYADRVVGEASPMDDSTRAKVAALLRAGVPPCTVRAPEVARDEAGGGTANPVA